MILIIIIVRLIFPKDMYVSCRVIRNCKISETIPQDFGNYADLQLL